MSKEEWRDVTGYEGLYQVSNLGQVKALPKVSTWISKVNKIKQDRYYPERILNGTSDGRYRCVVLSKDGNKIQTRVHTLVAEAFIGPRPSGTYVCHKDDFGEHNSVDNLYYGSSQQNSDDKVRLGNQQKGEACWKAKTTEDQIRQVKSLLEVHGNERGYRKKVSELTGVSVNVVKSVNRGASWKHVK